MCPFQTYRCMLIFFAASLPSPLDHRPILALLKKRRNEKM